MKSIIFNFIILSVLISTSVVADSKKGSEEVIETVTAGPGDPGKERKGVVKTSFSSEEKSEGPCIKSVLDNEPYPEGNAPFDDDYYEDGEGTRSHEGAEAVPNAVNYDSVELFTVPFSCDGPECESCKKESSGGEKKKKSSKPNPRRNP